jgi:hypothetical protein
MSYPISELVTQNVVDTLAGVQTTSGYNVNLRVEPYDEQGNNTVGDLVCIVGFGADELADDNDTPIGFTAWRRPYWAMVYIFHPEAVTTQAYNQRVNVVRADVEKAIMQDYSRGLNAQNTWTQQPTPFQDANDAKGIIVRFTVLYRHLEGNPYSLES